MTTKTTTRAPLNAVIDDEDEAPARRPVARPRTATTSAPTYSRPEAQMAQPPKSNPSRTTQTRAANGVRQFNVEIPNETYVMLASLKLTRQIREGGRATLQMLVLEAITDLLAREKAKNLHAE